MTLRQTGGSLEPPPCKNSRKSGVLLPPAPKYLTSAPTASTLSSNYSPPSVVIIQSRQNPPKVFKLQHRHQRSPAGLKGHHSSPLHLFLPPSLPLLLLLPGAHFHGLFPSVESPPCDEYVTLGSAREGVDPLLQYHYHVLHVVVHEVYLECAAARRLPRSSSHWASDVVCRLREI